MMGLTRATLPEVGTPAVPGALAIFIPATGVVGSRPQTATPEAA